jgi:hypothetical protein
MLCSRSWAGRITWDMFHQIKQRQPILRPKLYLPYRELQALAVLSNHLLKSVVREICTLRSVGTGGGRPPPVTRCSGCNSPGLLGVCHERRVSCLRRATVREMKEGPSSSGIRSRSQATASCCGQKPWW